MNGDDHAFAVSGLFENVVTALISGQLPTLLFHRPGKLFARDLFHTATSMTLEGALISPSGSPAASQPSMASRRLALSSSIVSPCVTQPGSDGTSAQYPPSSASWMMAFKFIQIQYQYRANSQAFTREEDLQSLHVHRRIGVLAG
jgi:hypothetical protein